MSSGPEILSAIVQSSHPSSRCIDPRFHRRMEGQKTRHGDVWFHLCCANRLGWGAFYYLNPGFLIRSSQCHSYYHTTMPNASISKANFSIPTYFAVWMSGHFQFLRLRLLRHRAQAGVHFVRAANASQAHYCALAPDHQMVCIYICICIVCLYIPSAITKHGTRLHVRHSKIQGTVREYLVAPCLAVQGGCQTTGSAAVRPAGS